MFRRIQKLSKNNSLFLFGARQTGKTTLLNELFKSKETLWIDLLTERDEDKYGRHPDQLSFEIASNVYDRVVIDEVQKFPKLLDIVQIEIEKNKKIQFILTGSSSRKLKSGGGNLLGGRAFVFSLFPLTSLEIGNDFNLDTALKFGTLPKVFEHKSDEAKQDFLRAYIRNYLKEEVLVEQLVKNLDPFRDFLEIAAQSNGKILNYSKISQDVGVDDKTIKSYYQILEDTLLGFIFPPFHRSIRKRQRVSPKFYFFDTGVKRALDRTLTVDFRPQTFAYGDAFEHWIIIEIYRLNEYFKKDFKLSYLRTKDDVEIDMIIERPGQRDLLLEIKSKKLVGAEDCKSGNTMAIAWDRDCDLQIWSQDPSEKRINKAYCLFWQTGLKKLFSDGLEFF